VTFNPIVAVVIFVVTFSSVLTYLLYKPNKIEWFE